MPPLHPSPPFSIPSSLAFTPRHTRELRRPLSMGAVTSLARAQVPQRCAVRERPLAHARLLSSGAVDVQTSLLAHSSSHPLLSCTSIRHTAHDECLSRPHTHPFHAIFSPAER